MGLTMDKLWYSNHPLRWFLWPIAYLYKLIAFLRRIYLIKFHQEHFAVPVIVVGNLTVGGVGKTPLVIVLAKEFCKQGLRVGIVTRGYGASIKKFPHEVRGDDEPTLVGDEPLLLARNTPCPVVIAPKRVEAVRYLIAKHRSQIIISDDGLQHYAMGRAVEIVVIDGVRKLGNGLCLPAGPLREGVSRLQQADLVVVNGGEWPGALAMDLRPAKLKQITSNKEVDLANLVPPIGAVAAIGHPQRFFDSLGELGLKIARNYSFADHHAFTPGDLPKEKTLIMTEKDAVKCRLFAQEHWYFLAVEAKLEDLFWQALWSHEQLKRYRP